MGNFYIFYPDSWSGRFYILTLNQMEKGASGGKQPSSRCRKTTKGVKLAFPE